MKKIKMLKRLQDIFRQFFPKRMKNHQFYTSTLKGLKGIEIGGPTSTFNENGFLPIYKEIGTLDGCNFSANTVWEGSISEGNNYHFGNKIGKQIISDGTNLHNIENEFYDFVLSSHSIEHFANPFKAITEWKRIIKPNGYILFIIPHKDNTFDNKRPITTLNHLINDYEMDIQENDTTHFEEVIQLHDLSLDYGINNHSELLKRTEDNFNNRCLHHHVFNTPLAVQMADFLNLKICDIQHFNPFHIILLLQKTESIPDNKFFLNQENRIYHKSNFPSDKIY